MRLFCYFKNVLIEWKERHDLALFRAKWRSRNKNNLTNPGKIFPIECVSVGHHSYGTLNVISYGTKGEKLEIGNYCSIAGSVFFLLSGEHNYKSFLTYPVHRLIIDGQVESKTKGPIVVGDDVWIGFGSLILSGVRIGKGAVIAAGSIVTKDVPPYSIWINNTVYKYRFDDDVINLIKGIDYSKIDDSFIKQNSELFEGELNKEKAKELSIMLKDKF